jgi:hypothetical protein
VWDDGSNDASDDPSTNSSSSCQAQGGTFFAGDDTDFNSDPQQGNLTVLSQLDTGDSGCPTGVICGSGSGALPQSDGNYDDETARLQTEVFLQALGNNFLQEFKSNGCFAQFADEILTGTNTAPGTEIQDVVKNGSIPAAAGHQVARGLVAPLKSSIYRNILKVGEVAEGAGLLFQIKDEFMAGIHEAQSFLAGTCQ